MSRPFTDKLSKRSRPALILACFLGSLFIGFAAVSSAAPERRQYVPVYASRAAISGKQKRGTLKGDFLWAAASPTLRTAAWRWEAFLKRYNSSESGVGDGYEAQLVAVAGYELLRVYYLLGNVKAGDKLLINLDPLRLLPEEEKNKRD